MELVLAALLPGWRGALPTFFPRHVRVALTLSGLVAGLCALCWTGRPFRWLDAEGRERVLERMARAEAAPLRALVQWWKLVALATC